MSWHSYAVTAQSRHSGYYLPTYGLSAGFGRGTLLVFARVASDAMTARWIGMPSTSLPVVRNNNNNNKTNAGYPQTTKEGRQQQTLATHATALSGYVGGQAGWDHYPCTYPINQHAALYIYDSDRRRCQ